MLVNLNKPVFMDLLNKAKDGDAVAEQKVKSALQAFLYEPKIEQKRIKSGIQGVTVSTDLAEITKKAFNITLAEDNFDLGYEDAFQMIQLGEYELSWEVFDVANSLTFVQVAEGQRIQIAGITGTKATAYAEYYGGALGVTDRTIRTRKLYAMVDAARVFRNKFWISKADVHYALMATAAANNITLYNATATGELRRDIATINTAIYNLTNRCKDKGYGDTAQVPLSMYIHQSDYARIESAFAVTTPDMSQTVVEARQLRKTNPITRHYTFNQFILPGHPIMCIRGNKNQRADALAPTTYQGALDPLTLNRYTAVWAIYGAFIGDTDQWEQFNLA